MEDFVVRKKYREEINIAGYDFKIEFVFIVCTSTLLRAASLLKALLGKAFSDLTTTMTKPT